MSHRIAQLSDTHFLEPGAAPEGGFAYDTAAAFEAVLDDLLGLDAFDMVAVTGDIADHGRAAQYGQAAAAFERIGAPVNVCPGNHDQDAVFTASMGRPTIATSRVVRIGEWCHLFVDSNAGVLVENEHGHHVDPDYETRLHKNGVLGAREAAFVRAKAAATDAEHLFIWLHHPPEPTAPLSADDAYADEWRTLIADLPNLRGIAGGHTHVPGDYEVAGVPVFMAPAFKNNFDLAARTLLPPGYRTFAFDDNGAIDSDVRLVDDPRWPRAPYGRAVHSLMMGEIDWAAFEAIVARKTATA